MILRVWRNEGLKVKGLDLSLVGFRGTLALVDELEMVLNAAQQGTDEPGKPLGSGCPASQRVPPRCRTQYSYAPTLCDSMCAPFGVQ